MKKTSGLSERTEPLAPLLLHKSYFPGSCSLCLGHNQPAIHLSDVEASWGRGAKQATTPERQLTTDFSLLQPRWSLTEVGCQSPWKHLVQPHKLPRSQKKLISSTTLRDLFRARFVKSTFQSLLQHSMSQKRWPGSLQEPNGLAFICFFIAFWGGLATANTV